MMQPPFSNALIRMIGDDYPVSCEIHFGYLPSPLGVAWREEIVTSGTGRTFSSKLAVFRQFRDTELIQSQE